MLNLNQLRVHDAADGAAGASLTVGTTDVMVTEPGHPHLEAWWPTGHVLGWDHTFTNQAADLLRCLAAGTDLSGYSTETWIKLLVLTATAQLLGHSLLNRVVRGLGPSVTSTAILLEAPGAALIAAVWLGQTPPWPAYPALGVILLGLALVIRAERPPRPVPPAPAAT